LDSVIGHFINLVPPGSTLPANLDVALRSKLQIPRCKLLSMNIATASNKLNLLKRHLKDGRALHQYYDNVRMEETVRKKEQEEVSGASSGKPRAAAERSGEGGVRGSPPTQF